MFGRELKVNFKNFLIWTIILIAIFLVVFLVYPSIITSDNIKMMDEMMAMFPEEMLKAFNMDITSIDSAYGWLKTEGFIFVLLITGVFASILGGTILLKEESDKTIEYLNSLPISRNRIVSSKVIISLIYIVLMILILGIFNFIALTLSGEFDTKQYVLLSITPVLSALPMFAICLFISTFAKKTKKIFSVCLGISIGSYFLQILSELNETTEFLKYFSVYTLADIRNVILDISINPVMIIISLGITLVFIGLSIIRYNKKELV